MNNTTIEWTDRTWNPVTGCTKVSQGCKNCYAERMHERFNGKGSFRQVICHDDRLTIPLKWKKSSKIFVNSMSDLFHESIPFEFIDKVYAIMALCPQHTFQVLTKRPARMAEYFKTRDENMVEIRQAAEIIVCRDPHLFHVTEKLKGEARKQIGPVHITSTILPNLKEAGWFWDVTSTDSGNESKLEYEGDWPLKNVWLGVSVENQQTANERIPLLVRTPAAVRFLSCEPLLEKIKITFAPRSMDLKCCMCEGTGFIKDTACIRCHGTGKNPGAIHWVICGGESGSAARPMHPKWARSLRDQCQQIGAAFFFKQWGEWKPYEDGDLSTFDTGTFVDKKGEWCDFPVGTFTGIYGLNWGTPMSKVGKKKSGRLLDGREWNEMPGAIKEQLPTDDPDLYFSGFDS